MTLSAVRKILLDSPHLAKELRLNDGTRVLVKNTEQWLAGPEYLIVLVGRYSRNVAYRTIALIRYLAKPGRRLRNA